LAFSQRFATEIMDQLGEVGELTARRMFGALGLYASGVIFGMIVDETLYLRLDEVGFGALLRLGASPLRPVSRKPDLESARYISVPLDILEDRDELIGWVSHAIGVAQGPKQG
jgi:DNA transformation protein